MKYPSVDVIIPTHKPGRTFSILLKRLLEQDYPISTFLIINTEEKYWNPELTEDLDRAEVFHIERSRFDHAGTRNMGAGFSSADYVMFMTQDAVPKNRSLVRNLLAPFANPDVRVSYARQLPRKDCGLIEGYIRDFNYPEESMIKSQEDVQDIGVKAFFCSDVCACYDRKFHQDMGGFSEPCIFNEDMIFAAETLRRGYSVAYAADAKVIHSHNYSCMQQFRRNFDNGVSQAMHPDIFDNITTESEGVKMLKDVAGYLNAVGKAYLIPELVIESTFKYAGFRLGKMYRKLPKNVACRLSMNRNFWTYGNMDE